MKLFLVSLQIFLVFVALFAGEGMHLGFAGPLWIGVIFFIGMAAALNVRSPIPVPIVISFERFHSARPSRSTFLQNLDPLII